MPQEPSGYIEYGIHPKFPSSGTANITTDTPPGWARPARESFTIVPGSTIVARCVVSSNLPVNVEGYASRGNGPVYDFGAKSDPKRGENILHEIQYQIPKGENFKFWTWGINQPNKPVSGQIKWTGKEVAVYPPGETPEGETQMSSTMLLALGGAGLVGYMALS